MEDGPTRVSSSETDQSSRKPKLGRAVERSDCTRRDCRLRQACQRLGSEHLTGFGVYVLAHPCPTCLGALYYCSPDNVFFLTQREEYEKFYTDSRKYFEFGEFYDEYAKEWDERDLPLVYEQRDEGIEIYERWQTLDE
ncbi:hypothetical protein [Halomarina rubra]|uniref:CMP/dCMP-type deaminase domain-containing protein n=1 Tax=Halomarina rubra TaxID=2071873 RepID=A0ABD6AY74_9EURY|nr:hypothetical protein [Halomarina rubra]